MLDNSRGVDTEIVTRYKATTMFVAVPFHPAVPTDYSELAKTIRKLGTNPNHTLAVASTRSYDEEAFQFADSLSDHFGRHVKITVEKGTAAAANRFLIAVLRAFSKFQPSSKEPKDSPLLYLDPTYRPNSPRWLDDLQTDYFAQGAPMVYGNFKEAEPPTVLGPVIISKAFLQRSSLVDFLPPNENWRDYLAWEMFKNSVKAVGMGSHESAILSPAFEA